VRQACDDGKEEGAALYYCRSRGRRTILATKCNLLYLHRPTCDKSVEALHPLFMPVF
jgi:hypothetical protein